MFRPHLIWLAGLVLCSLQAQAKAVFAHFMFRQADYASEIRLAQEAHIDGFAVNMGFAEITNTQNLPLFFGAAEALGFKLFFSFDYAGNGAWPKSEVTALLKQYMGSSAYYHRGNQPLASTFEGPTKAADWKDIKAQTGCFFIPSFSSLGAKKAVATGVVDGLFSWGSWPEGPNDMDTEVDASYVDFLGGAEGKPYMMPVSPWFYTNMPGFSKNWLWRGDSLWFDRWNEISWNDYGESHYIGPLDDRQYEAFTRGEAPFNYVKEMPHDGWRQMLPFVIDMYKNNIATVTKESVVAWYRLSPASACGTGGTTGNTASQVQDIYAPGELAQDRVFFSALLGSTASVTVTIGGVSQSPQWDNVPDGGVGIYHGSVPFNGATGQVIVTVNRGGTIAQVVGKSISNSCANGMTNWNAWVGSASSSGSVSATPPLSVDKQVCRIGRGKKDYGSTHEDFSGICAFTCNYGYCPLGPCTCDVMGAKRTETKETGDVGFPAAGRTCSYKGLCSYACNHGYCPSSVCTTDSSLDGKCIIPQPEPEAPGETGCIKGHGDGNFGGLCSFACAYGFCPKPCVCDEQGPMPDAPEATDLTGYPLNNLGAEYIELCAYACERGYCPTGSCTQTRPGIFLPMPSSDEEACIKERKGNMNQSCEVAGDIGVFPYDRWDAVEAQQCLADMQAAWIDFLFKKEQGDPTIPSYITSAPVFIGWAFGGKDPVKGGSLIDTAYTCDVIGNGCATPKVCKDLQYSAPALVLESFGNMRLLYKTMYDGLINAESGLKSLAEDITETFFSPLAPTFLSGLKSVMEAFGMAFPIAGASVWEKMLSANAFDLWTRTTERAQSVFDAASTSIDAYEFVAGEAIENAKDTEEAISTMIDMFQSSISQYLSYIYNDPFVGRSIMRTLLADGKFLLNPVAKVDIGNMTRIYEEVIITNLIRKAWADTPGWSPVVMFGPYSDIKEEANMPDDTWLNPTSVPYTNYKYGDTTLWLVQVRSRNPGPTRRQLDSGVYQMDMLKGQKAIHVGGGAFKVQWQDFAMSAYDGWLANDKKNPFGVPSGTDSATGGPDSPTFLPMQKGVRTAGFFQAPVCSISQVKSNIYWLHTKGSQACEDIYPCCGVSCTKVTLATGATQMICNKT